MKALWIKICGPLGLFLLIAMEAAALGGVPYANVWVTPIGWYGYILFVDSRVYQRSGSSLLMNRTRTFLAMLPLSIALWCLFEAHNLLFQNWEYIGLPENLFLKYLGFVLSFSTILPAIIETDDLLRSFNFVRMEVRPHRYSRNLLWAEMIAGLLFIGLATFAANPYTGPLVWIGYPLLFAALNRLLNVPGLLKERESGHLSGTYTLFLAGTVCGIVWEFLNYWAGAKWLYHVPYWPQLKIFEMPILGYLGFGPFAIALVEMYRFSCHVLPGFRSYEKPS